MRRRLVRLGIALLLAACSVYGVKAFKNHKYDLLLHNFRVVEAGRIYRGGQQAPGPLRRIIQGHSIRTILCLTTPSDEERKIAEHMGVRWLCVPLADSPDAGGDFSAVERAADILAENCNAPVFFHCFHGRTRSNLVQAVYRVKHCGWTVDDALNELRAMAYNSEEDPGAMILRNFLERHGPELARSNAGP
jgi:protein tyrosine/serine phosphatase